MALLTEGVACASMCVLLDVVLRVKYTGCLHFYHSCVALQWYMSQKL
jgi:hypothetical protein